MSADATHLERDRIHEAIAAGVVKHARRTGTAAP